MEHAMQQCVEVSRAPCLAICVFPDKECFGWIGHEGSNPARASVSTSMLACALPASPSSPTINRQERRGERVLARAALALVAVQAACAYVVWVATIQQAQHQHQD